MTASRFLREATSGKIERFCKKHFLMFLDPPPPHVLHPPIEKVNSRRNGPTRQGQNGRRKKAWFNSWIKRPTSQTTLNHSHTHLTSSNHPSPSPLATDDTLHFSITYHSVLAPITHIHSMSNVPISKPIFKSTFHSRTRIESLSLTTHDTSDFLLTR